MALLFTLSLIVAQNMVMKIWPTLVRLWVLDTLHEQHILLGLMGKILDRLSDGTYELLSQDGSTLHVHRNHLIPYCPKEPLLYPHLRNFMRFSDSINLDVPKPIKYAISDSSNP